MALLLTLGITSGIGIFLGTTAAIGSRNPGDSYITTGTDALIGAATGAVIVPVGAALSTAGVILAAASLPLTIYSQIKERMREKQQIENTKTLNAEADLEYFLKN